MPNSQGVVEDGVLPSRSELSPLRHGGYNKSDLLGDPCSGKGGGVFFF